MERRSNGALKMDSGRLYGNPYSISGGNVPLPEHHRWVLAIQILTAVVRAHGGRNTEVLGHAFAFIRCHAQRIGASMEHLSSPLLPMTPAGMEEKQALCHLFSELCVHREMWYHHADAEVVSGLKALLMRSFRGVNARLNQMIMSRGPKGFNAMVSRPRGFYREENVRAAPKANPGVETEGERFEAAILRGGKGNKRGFSHGGRAWTKGGQT